MTSERLLLAWDDDARPPTLSRPVLNRAAVMTGDTLLLGLPADTDRTPWENLSEERKRQLAGEALGAAATPRGSWTALGVRGQEVVLRTDPYGMRPLFWRREPNLRIAEQVWPLLRPDHPLDPLGVMDFVTMGHGFAARTWFDGISVSEADSILTLAHDRVSVRYLDRQPPKPLPDALVPAVDAMEAAFERLYEPYGRSERWLIGLSGGLDSRVLLALALERGLDVQTWTATHLRGSVEEDLARRVARAVGVAHEVHHLPLSELAPLAGQFVRETSGQISIEHMHGWGFQERFAQDRTLMPNGAWGENGPGGALLGPQGQHASDPVEEHLNWLVGQRDVETEQSRAPGIPDWSEGIRSKLGDWYQRVGARPRLASLMASRNRPSRMNVWAPRTTLPRLDYALPFLDEDVLGASFGMAERWQRHSTAYRTLVVRRWPELARIPWQKTGLRVDRTPTRLSRKRQAVRRALRPSKPSAFTDPTMYGQVFADAIERAEREFVPVLEDLGVDARGMLADHPAASHHGRELRLRLATLHQGYAMTRG